MYLCFMNSIMRFSLISIAILLTCTACKNDLKLNAPYKEVPSIYAILNPQDNIQLIRINKVFLGEGDANQMAQIADSINYQAGDLTVSIQRANEIGAKDPAIYFKDSLIKAKSGAFNSTQRVYVTSNKIIPTGVYVLTVKNNKTGNVFTAKAAAIDSVKGDQGSVPISPPYYPYLPTAPPDPDNSMHFINYKDGANPPIKYSPNEARSGKLYQLVVRMHFYDSLFNNQKVYRYVDYSFGNQNIKDALKLPNGLKSLTNDFKKDDFFFSIGLSLSKMGLNDNLSLLGRKMYKIQYFIYSTTQDYIDYLQYNSPSLSISQNKPLYSNFDSQAALGIFTFRTRCSITKELAKDFVSEFAFNKYTCGYRFYTSALNLPGCP
jgi:hypothetical protein